MTHNTHSEMRLISYVVGGVASLGLTAAAFALVVMHLVAPELAVAAVLALALVQIFVQLNFFFHFGSGRDSRERLAVLAFAGLIVFILVGGSLWIMRNLNDRMMPSTASMNQYMDRQEGI